MRGCSTFITSILFFSLIGCKSSSDKVLEEFKKVNENLEKTNKDINSLYKRSSLTLDLGQNTLDSIELVLRDANTFLETAKTSLELEDNSDEKLAIAQKLFINTTKGDSLFNHVMSILALGIKYSDSESERKKFTLQVEPDKNKWLRKYFKMIPTIAAKTILSKFQNDCLYISRMIWGIMPRKC